MPQFVIEDLTATVTRAFVKSLDPLEVGSMEEALVYDTEFEADEEADILNLDFPGRFGSNPKEDPPDH